MITFSSIIKKFKDKLLNQYGSHLLPSHHKALNALNNCRTDQAPLMLARCDNCEKRIYAPHSCGHRNCPHCQHHESQQWIERQLKKQVPGDYFLLTFTLPAELRPLAWNNQNKIYSLIMQCGWNTLNTFSQNDKQLQGTPGVVMVLHTHTRGLDYHPHVHIVMPAAAINKKWRLWRTKTDKNKKPYLFSHKALAKIFRAKFLEAVTQAGLNLPEKYPERWVVHCKSVGAGKKTIIYLGQYLYRGVVQEKDIVSVDNGFVTFRYRDSKTKQWVLKTVSGENFLWLVLQHVLPKGFRRARNFGFLHPNSKRLIQILQLIFKLDPNRALVWIKKRPKMTCPGCGGTMTIIETRIHQSMNPVHHLVPT